MQTMNIIATPIPTPTPTSSINIYTMEAFFLTLLISIFIFKKTAAKRQTNMNKLPFPPGPTAWPLVGNIPEMIRHRPTFRWIDQVMKEMKSYVCMFRYWKTHVVIVSCPNFACEVVKKNDAAFASRPMAFCAKILSGGYLTTSSVPSTDQWKKMRKILTSEIINPARLNWLHDKRAEEADNLVFYINNQYKANRSVNLRIATRHYCGNVIRKMIFGERYFGKGMADGGPGDEEIKHVDAVFEVLKYLYSYCISDFVPFLEGFDFDGQEKIVLGANKTIRGYQNHLIDRRIRLWRDGQRNKKEDLLDVFINLQDCNGEPLLTPDEIKNQLAENMVQAMDNPSNAVEWTMAEMLNQPEIMKKATEEIDRVVGRDRLVQESDIESLNYVKACLREGFRLHPVNYSIPPHFATQDVEVGGYLIPKGSWVVLSRYGLGRNPNTWPDPLKFDPERHLHGGEVVLTEHELKFITFGYGRRGCVADRLGSFMTVMLLARLLHCFTWTATTVDLSEPIDELCPANPVMAFANPRLPPHLYPTYP